MRSPFPTDSSKNPIVGVVAEVRLYRECLIHALRSEKSLTVQDLGSGGPESLKRLSEHRPDVVLVDLRPASLDPFIRRAHKEMPKLLIVVVGVREEEKELLALFESGMTGFVTMGSSLEEVFASIRSALRGELRCPPRMAAALARRLGEGGGKRSRHPRAAYLTPREEQVLRLLGEGLTNKEIATQLSVEASTVKNHVHSILHKLSIGKRSDILNPRDPRPLVLRLAPRRRGREESR